ncbi:hypothetical protein S83_031636, partial [Arachis hypogaea]
MVKLNCGKEYYGVIEDIVELSYMNDNKVVMFKCLWWDVDNYGRGVKVDEYGVTLVNKGRTLKTREVFVMACQSEQVFYVEDICNSNWQCVVKVTPHDYFSMPLEEEEEEE